jgi:hypothetical protein
VREVRHTVVHDGLGCLALLVAVLALGASGVIGWKANRLSRRLVEIENTREEREEGASRSADLHVVWRFRPVSDDELSLEKRVAQWNRPTPTPYYQESLSVENRGRHRALDVRVSVDGDLVGEATEIAPTRALVVDEGEFHTGRPQGQSEFLVTFEDGRGPQQVVSVASPEETA